MGREVRRVPADWVHPKDPNQKKDNGYIPLHDKSSWNYMLEEFQGFIDEVGLEQAIFYIGEIASPSCYMFHHYDGEWNDETCTHYQFYEDVTEGTPKTPVFASLEDMAEWASENIDSWCDPIGTVSPMTGEPDGIVLTKEEWLKVFRKGSTPSMGNIVSGGRVQVRPGAEIEAKT